MRSVAHHRLGWWSGALLAGLALALAALAPAKPLSCAQVVGVRVGAALVAVAALLFGAAATAQPASASANPASSAPDHQPNR